MRPRYLEQVERMRGDQERERRVLPSRDAEHHTTSRVRQRDQPARERRRQDVKHLGAALVETRRIGRDERVRLDAALEAVEHLRPAALRLPLDRDDAKRRRMARGVLAERRLAHAVLDQHARVDVGERERPRQAEARGLGEDLAAFGDDPLPVPGEIGGRLAEAGGAVHLHRQVLRRRAAHQLVAVVALRDRDVRRRKVREHRRARERGERPRRDRHPEILANVAVQDEPRQVRRADEDVGAERDARAEEVDRVAARLGRGTEPA